MFQKAIAYMKICCTYEKQYTRSYIVHYRFLIFLNRIFPHLPFTSMLAKRSFLCLFRTQKDNTEKLFFSSFGEFGKIRGKICHLWCLVWPHAKIYHGLRAASPLSSIQIEWTAEGSDESPGGAQEIWKWGVGIGHTTSGVCSANQDIKHLFCSLWYICKGMIWICVLQCSSGPSLVVTKSLRAQVMLWVLNFEKYWPSTALPALFVWFFFFFLPIYFCSTVN